MKRCLISLIVFVVGLSQPMANALEVGDTAPDFALKGSDGQTHMLSNLRGKYVVLAFFPKAYTKG